MPRGICGNLPDIGESGNGSVSPLSRRVHSSALKEPRALKSSTIPAASILLLR